MPVRSPPRPSQARRVAARAQGSRPAPGRCFAPKATTSISYLRSSLPSARLLTCRKRRVRSLFCLLEPLCVSLRSGSCERIGAPSGVARAACLDAIPALTKREILPAPSGSRGVSRVATWLRGSPYDKSVPRVSTVSHQLPPDRLKHCSASTRRPVRVGRGVSPSGVEDQLERWRESLRDLLGGHRREWFHSQEVAGEDDAGHL